MRSVLNQAIYNNEQRRIAGIEHFGAGAAALGKVTCHMSVFSRTDLIRAVKCVPDLEIRERLVEDALADKSMIELFEESCKSTGCYTTNNIREDELKLLRLVAMFVTKKIY